MSSDEWQPISTAPRDGRPILLWDGCSVAVGAWEAQHKQPGRYMCPHCEEYSAGYGATHWRPLPPPPKGDGE